MLARVAALGTLVAGLALGAALTQGQRRRTLLALAVASVPLGAGLWANAAALPEVAAGTGSASLGVGDLRAKLQLLAVAGLLPAAAAWIAIRPTDRGAEAARGRDRHDAMARLGRVAAVTLATVAAAGGSVAFLAALGAGGPPVQELWAGASPALVVALSLVAAVAEEVLFRGVLFPGLSGPLGWKGSGLLQAGLFGLLHAGYGDPSYILAAGAFGLVQAGVTRAWGLRAAVLVHAQVNLVILGWTARGVSPGNGVLVMAVLAANALLVSLAFARVRDRRNVAAAA